MSLSPPRREDQAKLDVRSRAQVQKGRSGRQTKRGASGSELLVAGKHVPDRVCEPAGDVDLGDPRPALFAEPLLVALVALSVGGVAERVRDRLDQRPAQVAGPVLCQRAAPVGVAGLLDRGAEPGGSRPTFRAMRSARSRRSRRRS